ncbi:hypothetical protein X797_009632 [Metarhizium robertsii]|uniref:Phosphoglycerate mutase family protein n=1 Tax=Metarhizium robertsii TaxID=568076 RepID=A0A014QUS7_9HYPO|nr:hypothetical protein X797_009632 [Metarhizium robertsii]
MKFINFIAFIAAATAAIINTRPNYFLIRHAEKNRDGTISSQGIKREHCLVHLFGRHSKYNIRHIIAPKRHFGDYIYTSQRPYNTTLLLADSLGIQIDESCEFTDTECAGRKALNYRGPGNVLIAWEHERLPNVSRAIGGHNVKKYPGENRLFK